MIIDFINLKLDKLIENKEQFNFEKGKIYSGKIINSEKDSTVLLFKGMKIDINTNLNLKVGNNVEFLLEKIENENIYLKIVENNNFDEDIGEAINLILKEQKLSIKEEKIIKIIDIFKDLNSEEADIKDENNKINKEKFDISLLKALVYIEGKNIKLSLPTIKYLYSYFNENIDDEIDNFDDLEEKLKKFIKDMKNSESSYSKGINIINSQSKKDNTGEIEFSFFLSELEKQINIIIKKDANNDKNEDNKDGENYYLNIKTQFDKFGEIEIKLSKHKKNLQKILKNLLKKAIK